jgi:hypothetical protein
MCVLRHLVLGLAVVAVSLAVVTWLSGPRTAITVASAATIEPGMTLAEVESLLGGPAWDETTGQVALDQDDTPAGGAPDLIRALRVRQQFYLIDSLTLDPRVPRWQSNHVLVGVRFDAEGRVADFYAFPMRSVNEGPLDRLRRWLGL